MTYEEFMEQYDSMHEACPKCGSLSCRSTLVGYILNMSDMESYKDLNTCTCMDCGDIHTTHERVNKSIIRHDKLNDMGI